MYNLQNIKFGTRSVRNSLTERHLPRDFTEHQQGFNERHRREISPSVSEVSPWEGVAIVARRADAKPSHLPFKVNGYVLHRLDCIEHEELALLAMKNAWGRI